MITDIGASLRTIASEINEKFERKLAEHEMTPSEWQVLRLLHGNLVQASPSSIAEATHQRRPAISKIIDRLQHKGLIAKKDVIGDRRFQKLELTAKAQKLVTTLAAVFDHEDAMLLAKLNASEKDNLLATLRKLSTP